MKLTLNGKPFVVDQEPPMAKKAKAFLDRAKLGALFDSDEMMKHVGSSHRESLHAYTNLIRDYIFKIGQKNYYGSRATVKALQEERDADHRGGDQAAEAGNDAPAIEPSSKAATRGVQGKAGRRRP